MQESEDQGDLVFSSPPSEDLETSVLLRRTIGNAAFLDDRTFLAINDEQQDGVYARIIRSSDESFQKIVERKTFPLDFDGFVWSVRVRDGYAYVATVASSLTEFWKFKVPDPNSFVEPIAVEKCGDHRTQEGSRIKYSATNGFIHAGKLVNNRISGPSKYQMFMGDLQTGDYHTIRTAEHDSIQDIATPEVHISEAGDGRFFLKRHNIILMGYLPGSEVPLEDVEAAAVWRSILKAAQEDLLDRNRLSRGQILNWAKGAEEEKKDEKKKKPEKRASLPASSMVLRKRPR